MSKMMTIPESLSAPHDKVIYQMGLNTLKYQEIEKIAKKLIEFSNYTVSFSSTPEEQFTPSTDTTKKTMGSLVSLLFDLQNMDENEEFEDSNELKFSVRMSHGVIDRQKVQNLFQKVIIDRNNFTHHIESYYSNPESNSKKSNDEVLKILQLEYKNAEYLLEKLKNELVVKINLVKHHIDISLELMAINELANIFEEAYQVCKRDDGWAIWQQVIALAYKNTEAQTSIENLKQQRNLKSTKDILELVFPNWLFRDEPTKKGSRILVQVDNTLVNIDSSFPEIVISD
ncbi:hypothetical protein I6E84_11760 [Psychrobacter sp. SCQQ22]|uniref:hypothetical protein n=1 Tax=Psychrobacter sp. SCQQ22 TaxID=2792059 RepID=UPI0018CE4AB5|nr:hypothetical protein [Psychrobacter sp. SCQQ22]MBH0086891.1 hypothetical protein [Psychrobacter sp. SCQQ22]